MYLRCSRCHESTWIRSLVPGVVESSVACGDCGKEHDLTRAKLLGTNGKQQYETANSFAAKNGVDLPTAYSVLLGLITLEDARENDAREKEKKRQETLQAREAKTDLDSGAARRQSRGANPRARRRGGAARRESKVTVHVEREMARERRSLTIGQCVLLGTLAVLVLGLSGRHAYLTWANLVEEGRNARLTSAASAKAVAKAKSECLADEVENLPSRPAAMSAEVQRDEVNRVIQVVGPNPQSVLQAYCGAVSGTFAREPLGLTHAAAANERYGVFRDLSRLEHDFIIRIRKDRETGRWSAGDGCLPIMTRAVAQDQEMIRSAALTVPR